MDRPEIGFHSCSQSFLQHYYLKVEMMTFLRENNLPAAGNKDALKRRIARFLDGEAPEAAPAALGHRRTSEEVITDDTPLGPDFVCSEAARAFFRARIGKSFSFKVAFQRWLRDNPCATYAEACEVYKALTAGASGKNTVIEPQFEYNAYIRDFFAANPGRSLADAIRCWNHRKRQPGHHGYTPADLVALDSTSD